MGTVIGENYGMAVSVNGVEIGKVKGFDVKKPYLPSNPAVEDLLPFVRLNIKKSRLRKKFLSHPLRYSTRLRSGVFEEFMSKALIKPISKRVGIQSSDVVGVIKSERRAAINEGSSDESIY
ncbi:MAG: hypothetical protein GF334_04310 [Candidatus Altiarchaeales archaeon]|nr:hypothetical protein [Candidatus Altiarchaeales archaeon]